MSIIGFAQLHEEERKGNLERFAENMASLCDSVYVWDQDSQDNSRDYYEIYGWNVHYNNTNDFKNEISCKQSLLEWIIRENREGWILWLDGDSTLNINKKVLSQLTYSANTQGYDAIAFGHLNLWDSEDKYRVDNNYMHLDELGVIGMWKIRPNLSFNISSGLHKLQYPNVTKVMDCRQIKIHHYGFLSNEVRQEKYNTYKSMGQTGYNLERIIDISTLKLKML